MAHRIPSQVFAEAIAAGLAAIPDGLRLLVEHVEWVCGVNPSFAGLHSYVDIGDGRSYESTAHTAYPYHLTCPRARRRTTIVLPQPESLDVVVHELGHVLDERLGFPRPAPRPVSAYASTSPNEAMAEAFAAWCLPHYEADRAVSAADKGTVALFRTLSKNTGGV